MAEYSQSPEIEPIPDEPIAAQNDSTNMEQKLNLPWTMPEQIILNVPRQLLVGMVEVSQSAKTETSGHVSIAIQKDHKSLEHKLTSLHQTTPRQKIPRVHHQLLKVNEKAYEPYVVAIGPYHRGKDHLEEMEGQKVRSLKSLLQRTNQPINQPINQRLEEYRSAMGNIVQEASNCYSEPLDISGEEFVDMMVLDGCFIIHFLRGALERFCYNSLTHTSILHDLVLVENQLPLFVLCKLLEIIPRSFFDLEVDEDPQSWLVRKLLIKFAYKMPGLRIDTTYNKDSINNQHIVHLLHSNWLPPHNATTEIGARQNDDEWNFIRSATELREAGIEFEKVQTGENERRNIFDIKFEKGILKMPPVNITDFTESLYRSLIAWEQFHYTDRDMFLTSYAALMNSLINSGKDVELLCKRGIINNWLGDDEVVAVLFNRLADHINLKGTASFFYAQLFRDINKHYEAPWHARVANLKHNYFNTPWAFISFLAATLLLLLTFIQTTFAIFPRS